jgi:hypothetical protein
MRLLPSCRRLGPGTALLCAWLAPCAPISAAPAESPPDAEMLELLALLAETAQGTSTMTLFDLLLDDAPLGLPTRDDPPTEGTEHGSGVPSASRMEDDP